MRSIAGRIAVAVALIVALALGARFAGGSVVDALKRAHGVRDGGPGSAPKIASAPPLAAPVAIPFELRGDFVLLRAEVNGHSALLILDTGSGVSTLDTAFARAAGVESSGRRAQVMGSHNSTVHLGLARNVRVGSIALSDLTVAGVPLDAVQGAAGHDVHGSIGYEFFDRYIVTLDYEARTMTLSDPNTFTYAGTGTVLPIVIEHRLPVVKASIVTRKSGTVEAVLHLDLGSANYALRFATSFVRAHHLDDDTATVTGVFGAGVGGLTEGQLLRMLQLKLGNLTVERPSTALSHEEDGAFGAGAQSDGTIGSPVFRRTRMIIDYAHSRVILEPHGRMDLPDTVDTSGLRVTEEEAPSRTLRVSYVIAGSPGAVAGVIVGDELLQIDGQPVSSLTLTQARDLLRPAGAVRRLTLVRGGKTVDASVALKMVF